MKTYTSPYIRLKSINTYRTETGTSSYVINHILNEDGTIGFSNENVLIASAGIGTTSINLKKTGSNIVLNELIVRNGKKELTILSKGNGVVLHTGTLDADIRSTLEPKVVSELTEDTGHGVELYGHITINVKSIPDNAYLLVSCEKDNRYIMVYFNKSTITYRNLSIGSLIGYIQDNDPNSAYIEIGQLMDTILNKYTISVND